MVDLISDSQSALVITSGSHLCLFTKLFKVRILMIPLWIMIKSCWKRNTHSMCAQGPFPYLSFLSVMNKPYQYQGYKKNMKLSSSSKGSYPIIRVVFLNI